MDNHLKEKKPAVAQSRAEGATSNEGLAACPCGGVPKELYLVDGGQGGKWAWVYGSCCGEWHIEFRTNYTDLESKECKELARFAWNSAPRAANAAGNAPSFLTDELAVSRAEFEKKFTVPDGVVFQAWSYGAGYVYDKSKHVPGSIPTAEEFNRYWRGWISAWRTLNANFEVSGLAPQKGEK